VKGEINSKSNGVCYLFVHLLFLFTIIHMHCTIGLLCNVLIHYVIHVDIVLVSVSYGKYRENYLTVLTFVLVFVLILITFIIIIG